MKKMSRECSEIGDLVIWIEYHIPEDLKSFLRSKGVYKEFILESLIYAGSYGNKDEEDYFKYLESSLRNVMSFFIWSESKRGNNFWGDLELKYSEYLEDKIKGEENE